MSPVNRIEPKTAILIEPPLCAKKHWSENTLSVFDTVTVTGEIEDFAQPVKDRCGDDRVSQEVGPIIKSFV